MALTFTPAFRFFATLAVVLYFSSHAYADDRNFRRSVEAYTVPKVVLVNQDGYNVPLEKLLNSGKPVIVNFIYGSCTTICKVLSAGFANLQQSIGDNVQLVSISIDPENDTPKIMKHYLGRYQAKQGWDFLTGSRIDIDKVLHAFNAYTPSKTYDFPLTLIHQPGNGKWIRIYGIMSNSEFIEETGKAGL
jgi:protein SCO1